MSERLYSIDGTAPFRLVVEWPVLYQAAGDDLRNTLAWAAVLAHLGSTTAGCLGVHLITRVRARSAVGAPRNGSLVRPLIQLFGFVWYRQVLTFGGR
jgi:hypothetical protein